MIKKKITTTILALTLIFSLCFIEMPCEAASTNSYVDFQMMDITKTAVLSNTVGGNTQRLGVKIVYTVRDEVSNSSGFYITGVKSVRLDNKYNWYAVKDIRIKSITNYRDNHQKVDVYIEYKGSQGNGYHTYTAKTTIDTYSI